MEATTLVDYKNCSVCRASNQSVHLGINVCRACSVFYRRTESRKRPYICRSGTNSCRLARSWLCKKCRFEKIKTMVDATFNTVTDSSAFLKSNILFQLAEIAPVGQMMTRIHKCYNDFCRKRLLLELKADGITEEIAGNEELKPLTLTGHNVVLQAMLRASQTFLAEAFDEFVHWSPIIQWTMVENLCKAFFRFDNGYRSWKSFGEEMTQKICFGMTRYMNYNEIHRVFRDSPSQEFVASAVKIIEELVAHHKDSWKSEFERMQLTEEEFVACIGIIMWSVPRTSSEELIDLAEGMRRNILQELHVYYRQNDKTDICARIGEIFMMILLVESSTQSISAPFEFLKFFDLIDEETYKLLKLRFE